MCALANFSSGFPSADATFPALIGSSIRLAHLQGDIPCSTVSMDFPRVRNCITLVQTSVGNAAPGSAF